MSVRQDFLLRFFARLDEGQIPWCVLRNFDQVFADDTWDIDFLATREDLARFRVAAWETARDTGWELVQVTRFINHSWVFAKVVAERLWFVRIDVEMEIRWRYLHVLTAKEVLAERVRYGDIWRPSPRHEADILQTKTATKGFLENRYTQRLEELGRSVKTPESLRREIVRRTMWQPSAWARGLGYFLEDFARLWGRWRRPPGASLQVAVAGELEPEPIFEALNPLFPRMKCDLVPDGDPPPWRILFKGGLALGLRNVDGDLNLAVEVKRRVWPLDKPPSQRRLLGRAFAGISQKSGKMHLGHASSGRMALAENPDDVGRFLTSSLGHELKPETATSPGRSVALVGLDGAGKTTFARTLCQKIGTDPRFTGVRYFHWIPSGRIEFPWPVFGDLPRNGRPSSPLVSGLRLARNILRARIAFARHVHPWVQRGYLVLLDRFLYNYWLDPASVRYGGPERWLEFARKFMPRPDALIVLSADPTTLLARKGELSLAQIEFQRARLHALPALARNRIELDATLSPDALVEEALTRLP